MRIDPGFLREMSTRLAVEIDDLAERIYKESGHRFNINSPKQLGDVLFNKMLLPKPMKYGKGKVVSTAQDVLEELAESHSIAALVIEHRQLQKLKSTYLDQLPALADAEGRVHTTFNQVGTATGRLSSTNPNLQNIPVRTPVGREIRAAFIAAPGNVLMSADYSQIELRLMAHFSQDPLLLDAYRTGKDIHTLTASEVFGVDAVTMDKETRNRAKAVNFGIVYGISPFGLAAQLGIDQKTAREYIETLLRAVQGCAAIYRRDAGNSAARTSGEDLLWAGAADSGYSVAQSEYAWICGADCGQYSAAGNGGGPDQAGDAEDRSADSRTEVEVADDAAGSRRVAVRCCSRGSRRASEAGERGDGACRRVFDPHRG